jgi:plasmid stabilization system protein ParE
MRVRYTATAARELGNGIEYLTRRAPSLADDFADAIERGLKEVAEFPFSAQETEQKGVRRKYVRRFHYCIFYLIGNGEIIVLHIRHAAQRLPWENGAKPT